MKRIGLSGLILLFVSCHNGKKQYLTIDLNFTCTPIQYFDTLKTVLVTNDKTDLGGKGEGLAQIFSGNDRVYKKNLTKINGHFYVDSVEKKEYWLFLVQCKLLDLPFTGFVRHVDFTDKDSDTLKFDICVESNMRVVQ